jgi:hypothetical protein
VADEFGEESLATYTDNRTALEKRHERIAYLVAAVILIVGGATLRTPILNWICGPAIVVACVAYIPPLLARRSKRAR